MKSIYQKAIIFLLTLCSTALFGQTPESGKVYLIRNVNASTVEGRDLYLTKKSNGEAGIELRSASGQLFYVAHSATDENKFTLEHPASGTSLTDGGSNSWNTSFTGFATANTTFNLIVSGTGHRIQGRTGYYATDNTASGSAVYCDKGATHANGLWAFEEAAEEDVRNAAKTGLSAYTATAGAYYGTLATPKAGGFLASLYTALQGAVTSAEEATADENLTGEEAFNAILRLRETVIAFKATCAAYQPLKAAIEKFTKLLNASGLKDDETLKNAAATAQAIYDHPENQTENIASAITTLNDYWEPVWAYRALQTAITNANRMQDTNYGGETAKNTFLDAISAAQNVLDTSADAATFRTAIQTLKNAVATYLNARDANDRWITVKNGALWKDDRGKTVQAHGAGFLQTGDTWYMIGEDRETAQWNPDINMYSTKDFINWKYEGKVVENGKHSYTYPDGTTGSLGSNRMIERPKLLYCERTGQYIIWCHWEAGNYGASEAAVFYSDNITGPYTLHWAGRPMEIKSRDCNVFQDNDGNAYFVSTTSENTNLGVFKLSDDYLEAISHDVILAGRSREAPAIVRIGNTYHMLSSACTGWDPNQCQYNYSNSLTSGWSSAANLNNKYSYDTQAASILTISGTNTTTYLYVGDRWQDPNLAESKTIIFPIQFNGTNCTFNYSQQFDINLVTGNIRATETGNRIPRTAWQVIDYSSQQDGSGNAAANAIDGNTGTIWHTRWSTAAPAPHHITVDMGQKYEISGFLCIPRLDNDVNGLIRQFILYTSMDNDTWTTVAGGAWMPYAGEIYFPKTNARYFKPVALSGEYASVSELYMLQNTDTYTPQTISAYYQIDNGSWNIANAGTINAQAGQTLKFGPNASSEQGSWAMSGPNNTGFAGREVTIENLAESHSGIYTACYLNPYSRMSTLDYTLTVGNPTNIVQFEKDTGIRVITGAGQLIIESRQAQDVCLYNPAGILLLKRRINKREVIDLQPGVYLIKTEKQAVKIVI